MTTLYLKDPKGNIRYWEIEDDGEGIYTRWGIMGGVEQEEYEEIPFGKANRTQQEQIDSRIKSKIKKRIEKGYCITIEDAKAKDGRGSNILGLPRPMLASPLKNIKDMPEFYMVQPKLDGHRCLYDIESGIAYSRNGKEITAISEILSELEVLNSVGDMVLDGELYIHDISLQKISSFVKRRQKATAELGYYVYDLICNGPYVERYEILCDIFKTYKSELKRVQLCETTNTKIDPSYWLSHYRQKGYEGAIARTKHGLYENKRSKGLIKIKACEDDEFEVVDITPSKTGCAILHCISRSKKPFSVTAPGNENKKLETFRNREIYIGKSVKVEYANLTEDGVPFHPVAVMWRQKDEE